jgi:hypothetical protein
VKIEGADFYKVDEGFYIDGLSAGIHEFSLDGKNYSFDSSIVNSDNIVVANIK